MTSGRSPLRRQRLWVVWPQWSPTNSKESTCYGRGNLELVARMGERLAHFSRPDVDNQYRQPQSGGHRAHAKGVVDAPLPHIIQDDSDGLGTREGHCYGETTLSQLRPLYGACSGKLPCASEFSGRPGYPHIQSALLRSGVGEFFAASWSYSSWCAPDGLARGKSC